jgi:hypothetical protein
VRLHGRRYFEVEVLATEPRTQTIALGFSPALPEAKGLHLLDRATDLRDVLLFGYDLPKIIADGTETKLRGLTWRPLKDLQVGDRLGIFYGDGMLKVYLNGEEKVSQAVAWSQEAPEYGVVDVYGHVKQVRLLQAQEPCADPPPEGPTVRDAVPTTIPSARETGSRPQRSSSVDPCAQPAPQSSAPAPPADCPRRTSCKLARVSTGKPNDPPAPEEIALPVAVGEEIKIGRDRKKVDVHLDSASLPNFISRTHGILRREPSGVVSLRDNETQNGTFVNGVRVTQVELASGDLIAFGAKGNLAVGAKLGPGTTPPFQYRVQLD